MSDNGLKYAMALPLEPAVEAKIARLIKFADEHVEFFVKRWQRHQIAKFRTGPLRWFRRNITDEKNPEGKGRRPAILLGIRLGKRIPMSNGSSTFNAIRPPIDP